MSLGVTDLRKGRIFQIDGQPYKVVDYAQKVMGRGGSIVNVKVRSLPEGKMLNKTFKGNETVDRADIIQKNVQYLYSDDIKLYFMDDETYEQHEINRDLVDDALSYMKEGDIVQAQIFEGNIISIELPKNVPLTVTYAENAVKGDTTSSIQKDATLETGAVVKVPAFIKTGDVISVSTEDGSYRERIT